MKAQSLIDLLHEFRKVGAGNALAAGNFAHCTCPKPPGMKTKSAEEVIADAKKDPNTKELDRLIDFGHTEFLRRCFVFHPDEDKERLAKRDDWVLLNPKNGDELLLKTPLARAYGHLRAHTHRPETHTNETNGATKQAAPRKRVVKPKEEEKPAFTWGSAPDAFFHGTTEDIAAKILKSGLNPHVEDRANLSAKGYVYLSRSAHGAAQWGKAQAQKRGGKAALIRVVLPPELLKKVEVDDWEIGVDTKNDCRFKGSIPASCCSIYPMQGSEGGYGWNYASVKTAKDYGDKCAADYQNKPASIDLGDGFTLSYTPHPNERADGDSNTWQITNPSVPYKVGEVLLHFYEDVPHPSIGTISFDQHFQRKGLGRKVVQALSQFYGGLTSDPQRNTNDSAKGMWRGVPGVQEVPSPKRYQHGDKPAERRLPWETDEFLNRGKYFTVQGASNKYVENDASPDESMYFYRGTSLSELAQVLAGQEAGVYWGEDFAYSSGFADGYEGGEAGAVMVCDRRTQGNGRWAEILSSDIVALLEPDTGRILWEKNSGWHDKEFEKRLLAYRAA